MPIEYRPILEDEFVHFATAAVGAFGTAMSGQDLRAERSAIEFDRTLAAFEKGRIVGTTATLTLDVTLPGGRALPAGGLTWTGVLPTHRRQGVLKTSRFGYGAATYELGFSIDTAHSAYRQDVGGVSDRGSFEALQADCVAEVLPPLFQRLRPVFPGAVGRTPGLWSTYLADPEHEREGASALFHVVHRGDDGSADGYVSYRVKSDWVGGIPDSTLIVHDVLAPGPEVYAALWRYCLDVDLVATVSTVWAPVDEPLRWLLADPRRLRVNRLNDGLWLRILDMPAALAAREYGGGHGGGRGESGDGAQGRAGGDALVLDIADAFRPATAERYLLEAGPDGAACCRTMRPPGAPLEVTRIPGQGRRDPPVVYISSGNSRNSAIENTGPSTHT